MWRVKGKQVRISVVVPCFNEEDTIERCLLALLGQNAPCDEIVAVDNNSTDRTADVVHRLMAEHPTIRLITETTQGLAPARAAGFDAARGDALARIDADARARPDWTARILDFFTDPANADWTAVTGNALMYDAPRQEQVEQRIRSYHEQSGSHGRESPVVLGPCSAIRAEWWGPIKAHLSDRVDIHEDYALGIAIRRAGGRIWHDPLLIVDQSPRRYLVSPWRNRRYILAGMKTARVLDDRELLRRERLILLPQAASMVMTWAALKGWDPQARRWSLRRALTRRGGEDRISPLG